MEQFFLYMVKYLNVNQRMSYVSCMLDEDISPEAKANMSVEVNPIN